MQISKDGRHALEGMMLAVVYRQSSLGHDLRRFDWIWYGSLIEEETLIGLVFEFVFWRENLDICM